MYDPLIHHRQSFRLDGYDYAQEGAYFVTICTQDKISYWSAIENEKVCLSPSGAMVMKWWKELAHKFPSVHLDEFVIMPNHVHGIIMIEAVLRGRPSNLDVGTALCGRPSGEDGFKEETNKSSVSPTLGAIVDWFKTMTTNEYIRGVKQLSWPSFPGKLWQRNYFEHIIRDEKSYDKIRAYIATNPERWDCDIENPERKKTDEFHQWLISFQSKRAATQGRPYIKNGNDKPV